MAAFNLADPAARSAFVEALALVVDAPLVDRVAVDARGTRCRLRWRRDGESLDGSFEVMFFSDSARADSVRSALNVADEVGVRAPRPRWLVAFGMGAALFVTPVDGIPFAAAWIRRDRHAPPELLAEPLIALHEGSQLDVPAMHPLEACALTRVGGESMPAWWHAALDVLARSVPNQCAATTCHGDYGPRTVIIGRGGLAVMNWSEAGVGDPRLDVATMSLGAHEVGEGALRGPVLRAYRSERPVSPDELRWFEVLVGCRRYAALKPGTGDAEAAARLETWIRERTTGESAVTSRRR